MSNSLPPAPSAWMAVLAAVFIVTLTPGVFRPTGSWGVQLWDRTFPKTPLGRANRRAMFAGSAALLVASVAVICGYFNRGRSHGALLWLFLAFGIAGGVLLVLAVCVALFGRPRSLMLAAHRGEPGFFVDLMRYRARASGPGHGRSDPLERTGAEGPGWTHLEGVGRIVFYRTKGHVDSWRRYKVEIDGQFVGHLSPDSSLDVAVAAGVRVCRARVDWIGSDRLGVPVAEGRVTRVLVRARPDRSPFDTSTWLDLAIEDHPHGVAG